MTDFQGLKIGPVYWVKNGGTGKRLRVKIKGIANGRLIRTAWCGKKIDFTYFSITYIDAAGYIEIKCDITDEKTRLFVSKQN